MSGYNSGRHRGLKGNAVLATVTVLLGCMVIVSAVMLLKNPALATYASSGASQVSSHTSSAVSSLPVSSAVKPSSSSQVPSSVSPAVTSSSVTSSATVTKSTFKTSLFIGDFYVEGLSLYCGEYVPKTIGETAMSAYSSVKYTYKIGGEKQKVSTAAAAMNPGSIYIELGSNDIGCFSADRFAKYYGELVDSLKAKCKNAKIYVDSMLPVSAAYEKKLHYGVLVTNEKIDGYNAALKSMCAQKGVTYLDVGAVLKGADGKLPSNLASDGLHLLKTGYDKWLSYLAGCAGA